MDSLGRRAVLREKGNKPHCPQSVILWEIVSLLPTTFRMSVYVSGPFSLKGSPLINDMIAQETANQKNGHSVPKTSSLSKSSDLSPSRTPATTILDVPNESRRSCDVLDTRTRTVSGDSHDTADHPELITSIRSKDSSRSRSGAVSSASGRLKSRTKPDETDDESVSSRSRASTTAKFNLAGQASASTGLENRTDAHTPLRPLSKLHESPSVSLVRPPSSNGRLSYGTSPPSPDLPKPSPVKYSLAQYRFTSRENAAMLKTPAKRTHREGIRKDTDKKVGFSQNSDGETESDEGEDCREEQKMSVVVSPQRRASATQPHAWPTIPSPLLRSHDHSQSQSLHQSPRQGANAPQDLLRLLLSDVLSDFQRSQHADLMGLHLDFVKMGRGWTKELDGIKKELAELRQENKRLREENDRLRRGY
jgi:protein NEDD1